MLKQNPAPADDIYLVSSSPLPSPSAEEGRRKRAVILGKGMGRMLRSCVEMPRRVQKEKEVRWRKGGEQ
jgi:hypothetical protein